MDLYPTHRILLRGNEALIDKFIQIATKTFEGKKDRTYQKVYSINVGKRIVYFQNQWVDVEHKPNIIVYATSDGYIDHVEKDIPQIVMTIANPSVSEKVEDDIHFLNFPEISTATVQSMITYMLVYGDTYPFGLHRRDNFTKKTQSLLKRVFRSLDTDFDYRISLSDFSRYHEKYFDVSLSRGDMLTIFKSLHEGAEPLFLDNYLGSQIDFDDYMKLMRWYLSKGYGYSILQIIRAADFYFFFDPKLETYQILFGERKTNKLTKIGERFIISVYEDFGDRDIRQKIIDEFSFAGGAPPRFINMREVNDRTWMNAWGEWSQLDPGEAARHLLALGFPRGLILKAFGVEEEIETGGNGMFIGAGIFAAAAVGAGFVYRHFYRNM